MIDWLVQSPTTLIIVVGVLGLLLGSFLNVVIHRLPIMMERAWARECAQMSGQASTEADAPVPTYNLVVPRSACPKCGQPIGALQNIPVLSWLWLRGRCAGCANPIGIRYPLVELLTGVLSAAVAAHFGATTNMLCALAITWTLVALTFIDLDHQLLPDSLTLPLLWAGLVASLMGWTIPGTALPVSPREAIIGAAAGYLSLWAVYHLFRLLTGKEGMGYGDFKLLAAFGAWFGATMLLPIILMAATVGAVTGVALIVMRRTQRGVPIPFGPFLAAAGWIVMMWGPQLVSGYLGLYRH